MERCAPIRGKITSYVRRKEDKTIAKTSKRPLVVAAANSNLVFECQRPTGSSTRTPILTPPPPQSLSPYPPLGSF